MPPVSMARMNLALVLKPRCSTSVRDAVGARAELGAVDLDRLRRARGLAVDHGQLAGHQAPVLVGGEAELLLGDAEQGLDVVQDGVRLDLLVAARLVPVLGLVVGVALGGAVVGLDQLLRERDHAHGLGEGLDRRDGQGALLLLAQHLEVPLLEGVAHVREVAQRELHGRLAAGHDLVVQLARGGDQLVDDGASGALRSGQGGRHPPGPTAPLQILRTVSHRRCRPLLAAG